MEWTAIAPWNSWLAKGMRRMSATTVSRSWPSRAEGSMSTPIVSRGDSR